MLPLSIFVFRSLINMTYADVGAGTSIAVLGFLVEFKSTRFVVVSICSSSAI